MDHHDPARTRLVTQLVTVDVLLLDDFLTTPLSAETANALYNILASREGRVSTLVTSQFNPEEWYTSMPDKVIAESMMNRLIGGADIVNLEGPNMRLKPTVN